ncbi:MAG: phosphate/phosphite/phosphonate ABC transporter substrate-binding protein [Gammaproteobacteria bacterium]|nr:phosphate/phosphite/phosphonate ABC transporter substrate-binding protein [Gammaproteobacteria bacterium]
MIKVLISFVFIFITIPVTAGMILGVHPYLDHQSIIKRFQPLANYLSFHLNQEVQIRVGHTYDDHLRTIGENEIDIAYLGPASYVKMVDNYGRKPLLARLEAKGKPVFSGHIIIRENSSISTIGELKNKYFAFGDQNSTMSSLIPKAILNKHHVSLDELSGYRHYKGHNNVALAVLMADADAGAVKEEVYEKYKNKGLKSLMKSPLISEHVFVARSNMSPTLVDKIKRLLLAMNSEEKVKLYLKPIKKSLTGLVDVKDEDYDSLRGLINLKPAAAK